MLKAVAPIHDLTLAIMVGGIAGVGLSIAMTFARAPSREIAGQIGNAIFGILGPALLGASLVVLAARLLLHRVEAPSAARTAALVLAIATALLAALLALWLTPRMGAIWATGAHAADGSGLTGEARTRFLKLHGLSNLLYMLLMLLAAAQLVFGSVRSQ